MADSLDPPPDPLARSRRDLVSDGAALGGPAPSPQAAPTWRSPLALAGLLAVAAARLLALPKSVWEFDEVLFLRGVEHFDPVHHRPHPPGYPLVIGLGKALAVPLGSPFAALVAVAVLASLVGYLALFDAYARLAAPTGAAPGREEQSIAVAAALLFCCSPAMLLYGPLALSEAPAIACLALALAAGVRLLQDASAPVRSLQWWGAALGSAAAAAVGCRPQLAVAVLPMLAVTLWLARSRRAALAAVVTGLAVAVAWLVPLLVASGGFRGLTRMLGRQAGLVAANDASAARAGLAARDLLARFLAHPWGPKETAAPMLLLAACGAVAIVRWRRRAAVPLLVLSTVDLSFALAVMDPADATRYALPSLLAIAFLAAMGARALARAARAPALAWLAVAALLAGFVLFMAPLLRARSTLASPPVQAIDWARGHLPRQALLLIDPPLAPHAAQLLGDRELVLADPGLSGFGGSAERGAYLLANGVSGWAGAVTFSWPPSAAFDKITRGYYRVVTWSPIPPGCRFVPLHGVYDWEPSTRQAVWRWLGEDAAMRFQARRATVASLTLALPPAAPYPEVMVEVSPAGAVSSAGVRVVRGGTAIVSIPLPAGGLVVRLRANRSFVPAQLGVGPDRRRLAMQLLGCPRLAG